MRGESRQGFLQALRIEILANFATALAHFPSLE